MSGCCDPAGYRRLFSERAARKDADGYRRKGLDDMARRLVRHLARGISGETVLEVGGGVGAIEIELLRAGAARSLNVELSPDYEAAAAQLAAAAGVAERMEHRVGDFVPLAGSVGSADVVVLHKVVCCYPYFEPLLGAAADHARRAVALTFPRATPLVRFGFRLANLGLWLARNPFRVFVHPPSEIARIVEERRFRQAFASQSFIWRSVIFERP